MTVVDDRGLTKVKDVSFEVRGGEVVGIAGVDGNGQTELIDALAGLRKVAAGRIVVGDEDVTDEGCRDCLDAGLGHIPEDRQHRGSSSTSRSPRTSPCTTTTIRPRRGYGWLYPSVWRRGGT